MRCAGSSPTWFAVRSRSADDGSVTAEFATVVPAVLLVLGISLAGMQAAGAQLRLQDAVADAARSLGRGDSTATAAALVARAVPGSRLAVSVRGDLVCAEASAPAATGGVLRGLTVRASGCALGEGG